jgi:ABC-type multidrug transport system ATPase subunit
MPPAEVLRFRDTSYWYPRGRTVLAGVNLTVRPGEVVVVRGGNGSGKTTLLRLAVGAARARRGTVERAAPLGYQPQTGDEPPPRMTAADWLAAVTRMSQLRDGTPPAAVLEALGADPGARFGSLSRGTITKVLLAAALAGGPRLVLLDEPFGPLDGAARVAAAALIRSAAAGGAGVLLSDHHGAADLVASRVVRISGQRLSDEPPPAGRWKIILRAPGAPARELLVTAGERDAALLAALQRGEQVHRVEEIG